MTSNQEISWSARSEEKELESEKVVGTVTGASDYPHGCEGSGKGNVDSRQPLQKSFICISEEERRE